MNRNWLPAAILHTASVLAPGDQRGEWLREWRAELWYVPGEQAPRFALGAFRDAWWLRRNGLNAMRRPYALLESPVSCLAFLGALAGLSIALAAQLVTRLPAPRPHETPPALGEIVALYLLLGAMGILIGDRPGSRSPVATGNRWRAWGFFVLKVALILPMVQFAFIAVAVINVPPLTIGLFAGYVFLFRWVIDDQRRRCPVCLRLLTKPVRIGTSSQTFLDWYGAESMCFRGHGLLYVPEIGASYSREQEWMYLETSYVETSRR